MAPDFRPFLDTINAKTAGPQPFAAMASAVPPPAPAAPAKCGEVKVELKRAGDHITDIRIQCKCGEIIELACDY
jgi:hypothetical protein